MTRGSSKRRKQERQEQRQRNRQQQQGSFWSDDDDDSSGDARGNEWNDAHATGASEPNQNVRVNGLHGREFVTLFAATCWCSVVYFAVVQGERDTRRPRYI
jgi:hypothetical protein